MEFEWDPAKSLLNKKKHGLNFDEAVDIWNDVYVEVRDIARTKNEKRSATLGWIKSKAYVAVWTLRDGRIRIISVRRARINEEKILKACV